LLNRLLVESLAKSEHVPAFILAKHRKFPAPRNGRSAARNRCQKCSASLPASWNRGHRGEERRNKDSRKSQRLWLLCGPMCYVDADGWLLLPSRQGNHLRRLSQPALPRILRSRSLEISLSSIGLEGSGQALDQASSCQVWIFGKDQIAGSVIPKPSARAWCWEAFSCPARPQSRRLSVVLDHNRKDQLIMAPADND